MSTDETKQKSILELGYSPEQMQTFMRIASTRQDVFSGVVGTLPVSEELRSLVKPADE
jgi:hypothetical protein